MQKFQKYIGSLLLASILLSSSVSSIIAAEIVPIEEPEKVVLCIDAGHGGETDGAKYEYDGVMVKEKDLNLQIALHLQEELEKYENVEVVLTRTEDVTIELNPRVEYAIEQKADYLISIHNNAPGAQNPDQRGCMVLTTVSHYQAPGAKIPDIYTASEILSLSVVDKLQKLGIPLVAELGAVGGLVKRPYSPEGQARATRYYQDNSVADYYALIRYSIEKGLPAIIIEHAYLSSEEDYRAYLETEESILKLAQADAEGIAEALGLVKKPEVIPE